MSEGTLSRNLIHASPTSSLSLTKAMVDFSMDKSPFSEKGGSIPPWKVYREVNKQGADDNDERTIKVDGG